jgi:hypothetical protein
MNLSDFQNKIIIIICFSFFLGGGIYATLDNSHTTFNIGLFLFILGVCFPFILPKLEGSIKNIPVWLIEKSNLIGFVVWWFGFNVLFNYYIYKVNFGVLYILLWLSFLFSCFKLFKTNIQDLNSTQNLLMKISFVGVVFITLARFGLFIF